MGRKLNLSHLTEEECERIMHVLQKDFEVRQTERERIGSLEGTLEQEQRKIEVLCKETNFNRNCCIRCFQVFGLIFNRRRQCQNCSFYVCKDCSNYQPDSKTYVCLFCAKKTDIAKKSCSWFYDTMGQKFRRYGSSKVVRSLYKTTSYSDTELDTAGREFQPPCSFPLNAKVKTNPLYPGDDMDDGGEDENDTYLDDSSPELPTTSPGTPSPHRLGSRPASRAGSVDSLNLLSTSPSSSSSRQLRPRTPDSSKRHRDLDKSRNSDPVRGLPKWEDDLRNKGKVKKVTKDLYKHAFESARKAEEHKFKAKFDVLVNDLHRTLDTHSSHGVTDSFANTSYGESLVSFRGKVKDLLIGFSRRLQLAYESFESRDSPEDHSQQVKQNVSRFLEDLLGESLDITSDEAVSDLSSLSDDSANDRNAFEDQIAQAVVSKIVENHRREVHHGLRNDRHIDLSSPLLIPEALSDDDDVDHDRRLPSSADIKDTDITKDFEDLKHFVEETQSRSRQFDYSYGGDSPEGGGIDDSGGRSTNGAKATSNFDTYSRDRDFPPLPDFSEFEQIDFNSGEVDPDLVQMNLAVIPEETEEELEEEAADIHWRENWIFKGYPPSAYDSNKKHIKGDNDPPQYMMVPRPDDSYSPRVGNRDVDQLSEDLLDADDVADEDNTFYPRTSEELARISKYKRSPTPTSLNSPSLIPSTDDIFTDFDDPALHQDPFQPKKSASTSQNYHDELDYEDVSVGTDDFVGPIVQPTHKELKLLEDLVPADDDDPKFVVPPESVTIQEGEPVKLSCRVSGTQPIDVFWYREKDDVEELEDSEDIELLDDGERHQATLYNVRRQDAGQYMCIALSEQGKAIKYIIVTVKDNKQELKKPEFLKELKDVEVMEGQSVKFRCKVKGFPQPRINWYKDGNLLRSNKSCRIEKFGNRDYILTMDYATMDDDAEYMVVAKNVAGEVRSTAQVIVEPRGDGPPLSSKSPSQSFTTLSTDSESERPSSVLTDDSLTHPVNSVRDGSESEPESRLSEDPRTKLSTGGKNMAHETEGTDVSTEELTALTQHLEVLERHQGNTEEDNLSHRSDSTPSPPVDESLAFSFDMLDVDVLFKIIEDELERDAKAGNIRKLTSNALSVIRAAEEIIENERNAPDSSTLSPLSQTQSNSSITPSLPDDNKTVSVGLEWRQSSPTNHLDMSKSVSSGYGSSSMTSSAMDFTDSDSLMAKSSTSVKDPPSPEDEFALYLPPLDDDDSGSYREEVSISLSSKPSNKTNSEELTGVSSALSTGSVTDLKVPSGSIAKSQTATSSSKHSSDFGSSRLRKSMSDSDPDSRLASDLSKDYKDGESLGLNVGPKQINTTAYNRDYEVNSQQKGVKEEGSERKRWSVTLDPYSPAADVVNRQQPVPNETNEKISSVERFGDILHIGPGSPRGSNSSSTSRESLDSGVSSLTQERTERPPPVHMVGQTQEEEVPESRAEYDADSGIELPSVSRLRAMFGSNGKEEDNFRRIHSITARSLTKDQLKKLRDAGCNIRQPDTARGSDVKAKSQSSIQLQTSSSGKPQSHMDQPGKVSSSASVKLSEGHHQQRSVSAERRQIRTANVPEPARYQALDPSHQPVLIYPELEEQSPSRSVVSRSRRTDSPRPKSAIINTSRPGTPNPAQSKVRTRSESEAAGGQDNIAKPKIRSGCISARAAFWERRILQGEATDENVDETFPEMIEDSHE